MNEDTTKQFVRIAWDKISKGSIIDFQDISFADITYCAKHNLKECGGNKFQNKVSPSVTRCSKKNGGIGIDFFMQSMTARDNYYYLNNFKVSTPEFYRKKRKAYDNLMEFDTTVKEMILADAVLLSRVLNMPCMQKYETSQRNVFRRVAQFKQDALTKISVKNMLIKTPIMLHTFSRFYALKIAVCGFNDLIKCVLKHY